MLSAMAITLIVEVPIDNLIAIWTEATLPPDWQEIGARWAAFHTLRTFLALGAVAAAVGAALTVRAANRERSQRRRAQSLLGVSTESVRPFSQV